MEQVSEVGRLPDASQPPNIPPYAMPNFANRSVLFPTRIWPRILFNPPPEIPCECLSSADFPDYCLYFDKTTPAADDTTTGNLGSKVDQTPTVRKEEVSNRVLGDVTHLAATNLEAKLSRMFIRADGSSYFSTLAHVAKSPAREPTDDERKGPKGHRNLVTNSCHALCEEVAENKANKTDQQTVQFLDDVNVVPMLNLFRLNYTRPFGENRTQHNSYRFTICDRWNENPATDTQADKQYADFLVTAQNVSPDFSAALTDGCTAASGTQNSPPVRLHRATAGQDSTSKNVPTPLIDCYPRSQLALLKEVPKTAVQITYVSKAVPSGSFKKLVQFEVALPAKDCVLGTRSGQHVEMFSTNNSGKLVQTRLFPANPVDRLGSSVFMWEYSEASKISNRTALFAGLEKYQTIQLGGPCGDFFYRGAGWFTTADSSTQETVSKKYKHILMIGMGFGVLPFYTIMQEASREMLRSTYFTSIQLVKNSDAAWLEEELAGLVTTCDYCQSFSYRFEFTMLWDATALTSFITEKGPLPGRNTFLVVAAPLNFVDNYLMDVIQRAGFGQTDRYVYFSAAGSTFF